MIAVTTSGARLLGTDEDRLRLARLVVGIAAANGYDGTETGEAGQYGSALSYLVALDPPRDDRDAVIWSWTDQPTKSVHVARPVVPVPAPAVMGRNARGHFVRVA